MGGSSTDLVSATIALTGSFEIFFKFYFFSELMKKEVYKMDDRIGQTTEIFNRMKNKAEKYIEKDRQEHEASRKEKELKLANMSSEERQIVECVDKAMVKHDMMFCKLRKNEETFVKEHCIYLLCKDQDIRHDRPSSRMDTSTKDTIGIVFGLASEILDDAEVKSWNVTLLVRDLYRYNPRNKSQPAIEKIRRVPDPRAVNPLLKALKTSNKHKSLILSALSSFLSNKDRDLGIDTNEELISWASKYALISLLQPYSENPTINVFNHTYELIETVPEYASFIAKVAMQMSSTDPMLRIVAVKQIGADTEFLEVLKRISQEDPNHKVREAARTSLYRNHKINVSSLTIDSTEWAKDEVFHQENDSKSVSYNEINRRDFENQIEENEEYLDDIISGLYR